MQTSGIIFPSEMRRSKFDPMTKQIIFENLFKLGYPIEQYSKKKPEEELVIGTRDILLRLDKRQIDGKQPMMALFSNDVVLLQSLARIVPMVFATSTANSVINITTERLMELFTTPGPRSVFDDDLAGETLHAIKMAGLLWWDNFNGFLAGSKKFIGRFQNLMSYRLGRESATIFACHYTGTFNDKYTDKFYDNVSDHYGSVMSDALRKYAAKVQYERSIADDAEVTKLKF